MLEERKVPNEPTPAASSTGFNKKGIALAFGGGCALIACIALVAVLAVRALAPSIMTSLDRRVTGVSGIANTPSASAYPPQASNTLGDPKAPVKIVEYADFQCPYCLRYSQQTEPKIIEQYVKTGKVFYEYRSVGAFIGPESGAAAEAAYCAGDQGKFWEYHDTLFANWTGENAGDFSNDKLRQYATSVGLDVAAFGDCLSTGKYTDRIQKDVADAQAAGVQATPSFLINGKLLEGAQPFEVFQQAIDAALKGQ